MKLTICTHLHRKHVVHNAKRCLSIPNDPNRLHVMGDLSNQSHDIFLWIHLCYSITNLIPYSLCHIVHSIQCELLYAAIPTTNSPECPQQINPNYSFSKQNGPKLINPICRSPKLNNPKLCQNLSNPNASPGSRPHQTFQFNHMNRFSCAIKVVV